MKNVIVMGTFCGLLAASAFGCATSNEEQQRAMGHQQSSDQAARNGQYGVAGAEQRKAEDAHHKAVTKAIDEGKTIPEPTQRGDVSPMPSTP